MPATIYSQTRRATERQRLYMQEHGIEFIDKITVAQASALITEHQERHDTEHDQHPHDLD